MSMFSSRTREQIGCTCYMTDPSTWFRYGGAVEPGSQWEANYECFEHFPHEQHNPTNPILTWYREIVPVDAYADRARYVLHTWEYVCELAVPEATDDHSEHARRVLTRIAAIADGAS